MGEGSDARLRYNVGPFDLFRWWVKQLKNLIGAEFKFLSDHSIEVYSKKLSIWAMNRK